MSRKSTIGVSPLDTVLPKKNAAIAANAAKEAATAEEKERVTFHLSKSTIDRVRNAVYWTPGLTMAALTEDALADYIAKLEKKNGESFKPRTGQIKTGRPVKS